MKKAASLYNHPNNHKSASIGLIQENISVQSLYLVKEQSAKSLQSRPTLCDPIDGSPPGSRVPGILQTRTLEWVAISFSNAWKWKVKVKSLSHVRLLATPWTAAHQAPPSMGFSRQELLPIAQNLGFLPLFFKKNLFYVKMYQWKHFKNVSYFLQSPA